MWVGGNYRVHKHAAPGALTLKCIYIKITKYTEYYVGHSLLFSLVTGNPYRKIINKNISAL